MQKSEDLSGTQISSPQINVDADNAILGRLCSEVARYLLDGYIVNIVNCEKAIISGKHQSIVSEYRDMQKKHTLSNPRKGPFHPKKPDKIVRRTVRGMLPFKKSRGRQAYHRLITYIGIPSELKESEVIKSKFADASKLRCRKITVGDLCNVFGWKG